MPNSLLNGAAFFTAAAMHMEGATKKSVEKAARVVRAEARRVLGTYEYGWPSLAEATLARKSADTPGLETGAMRASLEISVEGSRLDWTAIIGSDDPNAQRFELGTSRQPPRSFLAEAARRKEEEVHRICGYGVVHSVLKTTPDFEDEWSYDGED